MSAIDFIKKEIMKTGYPVEMEIFSYLNSIDWFATPQDYYFDFDLNIAREIDIRATPYPDKSASNFSFYPFLAIECKKSKANAWVFFKTKLKVGSYAYAGQYMDLLKSQDMSKFFLPIFSCMLAKLLHYKRSNLFSMSYTQVKLEKSPTQKSRKEIFEAINQVIKYVSYETGIYLNIYKNAGRIKTKSCTFFFPIIVFDGKLYRATLTKAGISLKRANHIVLCTYYKPKYETHRVPFFIDIVKRKYFPTYLSMIEKEIDDVNKEIEKIQNINEEFIKELRFSSKTKI